MSDSWRPSTETPARRHAVRACAAAFVATSAVFAAGPVAAAAPDATEQIARGKYLAQAGDCMACHTAEHGGTPYAGGRYVGTPFGAIASPNITPDRQTGIGAWTDDDFYRTMHEGLGKHGEPLYPVMPFPWYTLVTRDDALAIKAYLFTLPPVHSEAKPNKLSFPYSVRSAVYAWRAAFFKAAEFKPDPAQTEEVNRGAYLANGLAHCGECHNARPVAGTSRWRESLQGGVIDNWYAPNITSDVRAGIGGWSNDEIATYLKTGVAPGKGIAVGPMAEAVHSLSALSDADLHAIAAYLKTTPPKSDKEQKTAVFSGPGAKGAQTYLNYCASCHGVDGRGYAGAIPALADNGSVTAKGPQNVISAVVGGLSATRGYAPMPAVGAAMSDEDVADVANYVRQNWGNAAAATAMPGMVAKIRTLTDTLMLAGRKSACPAPTSQDVARALADKRNGMASKLAQMTQQTQWQDAEALVAKLHAAAPKANQADLVNGLIAGYCPVVRADTTLDWGAKAVLLGQFGQLLYATAHDGASGAPRVVAH